MTLWKVTAGGVRLADELSRPVHPAAYALVTATPVALPTARTARSRVNALPRQRRLIRLRSDESAMPAVFGRTAVPPGTGHDLRPHRVIQGMDQLPHTRHPETVVPGARDAPAATRPADSRSRTFTAPNVTARRNVQSPCCSGRPAVI